MSEFKREDRYLVIKRSDLNQALKSYPSANAKEGLRLILQSIDVVRTKRNKQPLKCVVVESDWPEYEPVWGMIESRVNKNDKLKPRRICWVCDKQITIHHKWHFTDEGRIEHWICDDPDSYPPDQ